VLLRRPRRVLALALAVLIALGVLGVGVEEKLSPTSLAIPGTTSAEANRMLREHFGDSAPFVILLRGPEKALDRQGPALIRALRRDPVVTTLSPWDRGSVQRLRPSPRRAIVIADFHVGIDEAVDETVPELNEMLESTIHPPVRSTQTGFATLSRAIQDDSIAATERGELIAMPILLIVPAAGLPLARRGGDSPRLRGDDRDQLARPARDSHQLVRHRRLRARRLHDDGTRARGGLRAV
jgi:RND superfamily putative drug exporter